MSEHGTYSRAVQGCKCEPCRLARCDYQREYRRRIMREAKAFRAIQKVMRGADAKG